MTSRVIGEGDPRGTASARPGGTGSRCNLLDQYLAILLLVFAEAGLPDVSQTLLLSRRSARTLTLDPHRHYLLSPRTRRTLRPLPRSRS